MRRLHWIILLMLFALPAQAGRLLMVRSEQPFSETMLLLQEQVVAQGFKVSRVQRVDVGLTKMGFKTDKYRVVFFGEPEQIRDLSRRHPELIPYLPLKIAIFAEGEETLLITTDPREYEDFYRDPELKPVFEDWARRLRAIFDRVQEGD